MENYGDKVFVFLQNGKVGSTYTIDRICEKENQPEFIALVKEFMDMTPGKWEFNTDYTKLKRIQPLFETTKVDRGYYNNKS